MVVWLDEVMDGWMLTDGWMEGLISDARVMMDGKMDAMILDG